ncbi:VWA domain-containing protein [Sulfurivirga sp.]|uniref:nitric oxide reductase activation protein NorD n=1 Tax=Sulfurivirga sp. TaxID=2614236 RepID=UPI0025F59785|nr:VWA domain-containing protein [Sulfurivirga sp.]
MNVVLDEYRESLEQCAPELKDTLDAIIHEAARVMSPQALDDYLKAAVGFCNLGRGKELPLTWLEEMPQVVKECGDDIVRDVAAATMKLASMTSGAVLALLLGTLPTAARRLGDPELMRGYLALIHRTASNAPRGLRSMLEHIDELLSKLTLSGLRQWVDFGADAYRNNLSGQVKYFALETEDAQSMLQKVRKGTLFVDTQRKLNFYLRALWGRDFFLRPTAADHEGFRPYITERVMHVPDAVDDIGEVSGLDVYRGMAAHMAAHMMYTSGPQEGASALTPAQKWFIAFAEDARVEWCALRDFPGLCAIWGGMMPREPADSYEHRTMRTLEELALALQDADYRMADEELQALADRFHAEVAGRAEDLQFTWHLGLDIYNVLAARKDVPSLRILEKLNIPYRDDNRFVWETDPINWEDPDAYVPGSQRQVRKKMSPVDMAFEVDVENAGDDAQEVWICETEFYDDDGITFNEKMGREPISDPFHYDEWDYHVQLYRPDWATVYEKRQPKGDPETIDAILTEHKGISHRIRQIIDKLRPQGVVRERKLEDGEEIDINAAIDAMIDIRMGRQPDPRITYRNVINRRDLAIVVLLDLSESTNDKIGDSDKTVLDLTREACALVARAIEGVGDAFAIHGFNSNGRHEVWYYPFKHFDQPMDDEAKARLAGMQGGLSTRMGAAMRHAGHHLLNRSEKRKLLLVVTDGEPADIDERDPQYLRYDAKKAVEELHRQGVDTYCLTLDPLADRYVSRIFGATRYTVVDHVERLPEKLPMLFASLTS